MMEIFWTMLASQDRKRIREYTYRKLKNQTIPLSTPYAT